MGKSKLVNCLVSLVLAGCVSNQELRPIEPYAGPKYYHFKDNKGVERQVEMKYNGRQYYVDINPGGALLNK